MPIHVDCVHHLPSPTECCGEQTASEQMHQVSPQVAAQVRAVQCAARLLRVDRRKETCSPQRSARVGPKSSSLERKMRAASKCTCNPWARAQQAKRAVCPRKSPPKTGRRRRPGEGCGWSKGRYVCFSFLTSCSRSRMCVATLNHLHRTQYRKAAAMATMRLRWFLIIDFS